MASAVIQEIVGVQGTTVTTSAGVATGDYLVVFMATTTTMPASPGGTFTTGWTTGPDHSSLANGRAKSWWRKLTSGGSAITVTSSSSAWIRVAVVRGAHGTTFLDDSDGIAAIGATGRVLPSMDATRDEDLLIGFWFNNHQSGLTDSITPPAGMTEVHEATTTGTSAYVASQIVNTGATGTKTPTFTRAASALYPSACLGVLIRAAYDQIPATDSATGSDDAAVAADTASADSATGADTAAVAADTPVTDSATGSDTTTFTAAVEVTDAATGDDTVSVQVPDVASITDTGTGGDLSAIAATLGATDSATGTDAIAILRITAVTDSATGADTTGNGPAVVDSATGVDLVAVVDIPFTRVLPLEPERKYEVVVVARVMQAAGPPTFIQVDPLEWSKLSYRDTLGKPQHLAVTVKPSTLTPAVLGRFLDARRNPTELWVLRSGQVVFAGPLTGGNEKDAGIELTADGLLAYLEGMYVTDDQRFAAVDQATVVKTLIDLWQASTSGNFGIDTSTVALSGRTVDITYLRDETPCLAKILDDLGKAEGGFDLEVDPASRRLSVWSPQRGVDRSLGEDAVVLDSKNVTSTNLMFSCGPADIVSDVFATGSKPGGDAPLYSAVSDENVRAQFGRVGTSRSYSNVNDQAALDDLAWGVQRARSEMLRVPGPSLRVTPDADVDQYREGDTVWIDMGGELGYSGPFRIRSRTVTVDGSGKESVDLEPV